MKRARRHIVVWQFDQDRFGPTSRLSMVLATKRTPVALRIGPHKPHPEVRPGTSSQCLGRFLGPGEPIRKLTASSRGCEISYDTVNVLLGEATALFPWRQHWCLQNAKPQSHPGACQGTGRVAPAGWVTLHGLMRELPWDWNEQGRRFRLAAGKNDSLG